MIKVKNILPAAKIAARSQGWRSARLGDVLPLKYGKARSPQFGYERPNTATFGSNGAFGTFPRALTNGPAILVGRKGAAGTVHFSPEPCWPIDTTFYTEGNDGAFLPFFRYLLDSLQLVQMDRSTAVPSLSRDDYNSKLILYPESLPEQRRIVAEIEKQFTRLEAGVAALRRVQANLKRYRAAVLKAACEGKLVPTEAELAKKGNRKSKFETGEALLARILTERRQNWQGRGSFVEPVAPDTTILPKLPQGWTWATVEQLSNVVRGASPRPAGDPRFFGGNVPWITVGPLTADNSPYLKSVPASLNELGREHSRFIEPQTLLLTNSGATLGVPKISLIGGCINDGVAALMDVGYPLKLYLLYFLRTQTERLRGLNQGAAQPNLNTTIIKAINVPLPPLAEQTRIVAEVERRLSVVEELETVVSANLQRATRLRQSILHKAFAGELVATMPAIQISDIIPPLKPEHINRPNSHFARAVLSAEIVHRLHREPTFGRIKHQKIFHLCEHIAQIEEIHGQYHREAAGPLDNKLIYANEAELKKQKWYQEVRRESYGHAYQALAKAGGHRKYVERYWADKLPLIEKLIELMRKWDTERCEIFCTVYAAWNDLVLWGKQATEENILHEILERWHDSKKRFPKERWLKAIAWMKKEGFVPTGFGRPTKEPE
jgi:type I restriction enzyme S subunit